MQSIAVYPAVPILAASFAAIPSGRGIAQSALRPQISTVRIQKRKKKQQQKNLETAKSREGAQDKKDEIMDRRIHLMLAWPA